MNAKINTLTMEDFSLTWDELMIELKIEESK